LARNGQLRQVCGFWPNRATEPAPPSWVFSRFLSSLMRHVDLLEAMFDRLVDEIAEILPDYGEHLAIDGKALASFARGKSGSEEPDGRRDTDGEWGTHTHRGVREDGTPWIVYLDAGPDCFVELLARGGEPSELPRTGLSHVCMEVEDMTAELERLAGLGVEPQDPPKRASDGNLQAWVTDPEGNRVELMELSPEGRQRTYRKA